MILSDTAFRLALMRDLRTAPPDTSMCNAAADEIEDMMSEVEDASETREDLQRMIDLLIRMHEEIGSALDSLTCAGRSK
jgi:hypothetical protein